MNCPGFRRATVFFFNPIRYIPAWVLPYAKRDDGHTVIGLATTEMATAIENGTAGYVDTDIDKVIARMRELLADREHAQHLGEGARRAAEP